CKDIVTTTAISIQGKKYVKVEGWQAIAAAHGCLASAEEPKRLESSFQARGTIRRITDGQLLCEAHGFLGDDEPTWTKRPEYAKRAMAQTRAISRVCRSAFAHVVVLMGAGLETTPAEEVPFEGFSSSPERDADFDSMDKPNVGDSFASGKFSEVKSSEDGKCWFVKVGNVATWTRDSGLSQSIAKDHGKEVKAR